jgi:carboxymethylenebutenolidase
MDLMQYGRHPLAHDGSATESIAASALSRRFVMTSLASGFAVATLPVSAQTITTDTKGLVAGEVSIPVKDGKIPGYVARPAKAGKHPVILVVQEIFGVHEHIKDMCRRYAKQGYYAIAPEMFARQGDVSKLTDIPTILSTVVSKVADAQVTGDLDAALAFAKASGHANAAKVGLVGYCWGGRTAWVYANHNPQLKAAVAYYGLLEGLKDGNLRTQDPIDFAGNIKVPVLGLYSGIDAFVKQETIAKMRGLINKGGSGSEIVVFPNVDHGFNADYRPTYDKAAATYAQKLANDWFKKHGV